MATIPKSPHPTSEHATRDDNSDRTMCGRVAASVKINNGFPSCKVCERAIHARIAHAVVN